MASISDLEATIRACREMISIINRDIEGMQAGKVNMGYIQADFNTQKEDIDSYDISTGSGAGEESSFVESVMSSLSTMAYGDMAWQGDLFDEASTRKDRVSTALETAKSSCKTTIDELDVCIANAQEEIRRYEQQISDCEAEIQRIREAEAAAARAAAEAAAAAAAQRSA